MTRRVALIGTGTRPSRNALWRACSEIGADTGIEVVAVGRATGAEEATAETFRAPGGRVLEVRRLPEFRLRTRRSNLWKLYRGLDPLLDEIRPDLVHVHCEPWGLLAMQTLAAGRRAGARVAVHGADNRFTHGGRAERTIRMAVLRRVLSRIDGYACSNWDGVSLARLHGLPHDAPTVVAPPGIPDPEVFAPPSEEDRAVARKRFGLPADETIVGFVGRTVPEKGMIDLLEALRMLGPSAPFLAVWGSGSEEPRIRDALASGIRGAFCGSVRYADVADAHRACDLSVLPSRATREGAEQFGRAAVEALFCGVPVVAYGSGSLPWVLGGAGPLVPEGDVRALADAIRALTIDPELRGVEGARGRDEALRRHHPARVAEEAVAFWQRILDR